MDAITETARLLSSLRDLWDEEAVDELDHALQSAARALDDGADDELVLAAALHDIARSPLFDASAARRHDEIAQQWLTPRFGERVGWLAGQHVAAKRYLVATDPAYGAALSPTSVASLRAQGGAGVDAAVIAHPSVEDPGEGPRTRAASSQTVRLARACSLGAARWVWTAMASPAAAGTPTVEDVLAVAERVVRQRKSR